MAFKSNHIILFFFSFQGWKLDVLFLCFLQDHSSAVDLLKALQDTPMNLEALQVNYCKVLKTSDTRENAVIIQNFEQCGFTLE